MHTRGGRCVEKRAVRADEEQKYLREGNKRAENFFSG